MGGKASSWRHLSVRGVFLLLGVATAALEHSATPAPVTPVGKVVALLSDLVSQVEAEGREEAESYDDFACFCRTQTAAKSSSITTHKDNIFTVSSTIQQKTSSQEEKSTKLMKRKRRGERLEKDLKEHNLRCSKAKTEYEAKEADLNKAISSLTKAMQSMETSKPSSFLAIRHSIEQSLALASVLNLVGESKQKEVRAFLQVDGSTGVDPSDAVYKYHSQNIIDLLTKLQGQFQSEKNEVDTEWFKTDTACRNDKAAYENSISTNNLQIGNLQTDLATLKGDIATARGDLVTYNDVLKDDQLYLRDLTQRCEKRAKDWDQRSLLRGDELSALKKALGMLNNQVVARDSEVNERALLLQKRGSAPGERSNIKEHGVAMSFLQEEKRSSRLVSEGQFSHRGSSQMQTAQAKALTVLRQEGQRLQSGALESVAMRVSEPFDKVKILIQKLIERLLEESKSEVAKKGFCDEQVGKQEANRDFRFADTNKLDNEIKMLEVKESELDLEITFLTKGLHDLNTALNTTTATRKNERRDNIDTLRTAEKGLKAVSAAVTLLKMFYTRASKETVLLQASPVDEDTDGAGFTGAYKGKQESSKAIIGLLEVIQTDFERTVRFTEAAEKQAQEEFVEFDRVSRADISGKEQAKELDEDDLEKTRELKSQKFDDLETAQNLLDDALRALEDLKPTCIDTGMSYSERVAKREAEISALKRAFCILGNGVDLAPEDQAMCS